MLEDGNVKNLSFQLGGKGEMVIASFTPEGQPDAITLDQFMHAIKAAGFGGYKIHQSSLEDAAAKYNAGEAFEIAVAEAVDGKCSIRIDSNLMAVYLSCTLPLGGAPMQMKHVLDEVESKGITATLDLKAIDQALREGGEDILIASGRPPVPGEDGKFECLVPAKKERGPRLDEHGLADFRELGEIVAVRAGDGLMRLIPPTDGVPGETVTGKIIPVKPGKKVKFASKLEGAAYNPSDTNLLIAAVSGCPVVLKDGVSVEPIYTVKDVDLHTGNITFIGTVQVSGDVHANMTIKTSGDIFVDGTVESAMLEAGGDVVVKGGIIGGSELHASPDEKFHAAIKCNGSCTARFVQNAHISAGNGIFIHDLAMLSALTAGHQIILGDKGSRKGDIIGGTAQATLLVKAKNIGSPSFLKTVVSVGANQLLYEQHGIAVKAVETAEQQLEHVIKLLDLARSSPDKIPAATVKSAEATRDALNAEIETLRENEMALQKEIDIAKQARVEVEKHVFGGTEIRIGLEYYKTTEDREGGVFHLNEEGKLVFV